MSRTTREHKTILTAEDRTEKALGTVQKNFKGIATAVTGLLGTVGFARLAEDFVRVNTEYQKLNASLITVTGSAKNADIAFAGLQKFARETPFQVDEVVSAFIKMKALGLQPTEEALTTFGDIASGMGFNITEMADAVGAAVTGEMEQLKKFGIVARQQGDNVTFTYKGVSTTVKRTAEEIQGYFEDLGRSDFAGGMQRQMETIGGSISNLQVAWSDLMFAFGESGAADTAAEAINGITEALDRLRRAIRPTIEEDLAELRQELGLIDEQITQSSFYKELGGLGNLFAASYGDLEGRRAELLQQITALEARLAQQGGGFDEVATGGSAGGGGNPSAVPDGRGFNSSPNVGLGLSLTGDREQGLDGLSLLDNAMLSLGLPPQDAIDDGLLRLEQFYTSKYDMKAWANEADLALSEEYHLAVFEADTLRAEMAEYTANRIRAAEDSITANKFANANMAIGIMQMVAGKSKSMAIAAIVFQKGLAMAETFIHTQAAATAALAPPPLGLGPVAGIPLAAAVEAQGYVRMGLIAATGLVQAAQVASGGSGGSLTSGQGTYSSPIVTQPEPTQQAKQGPSVTINIHGNVVDHDAFAREVIPSLAKAINDGQTMEYA